MQAADESGESKISTLLHKILIEPRKKGGDLMKAQILRIEHFGAAFKNSHCAVLIATGIRHHIVLFIPE
jgi:hypothetical protein